MAIAIDANGTGQTAGNSLVTSFNYTGLTIGSALSNSAALFTIAIANGTHATGISVTWNGVACTLVEGPSTGSFPTYLYGILNPASGNQTLAISWTNANNCVVGGVSFSGVLQTSIAAAFPNGATNESSSSLSISVNVTTSSSGHWTCAGSITGTDGGSPVFASSPSGSTVSSFDDTGGSSGIDLQMIAVASTGTTTTYTSKNGPSADDIEQVGCDIVPAANVDIPMPQIWL